MRTVQLVDASGVARDVDLQHISSFFVAPDGQHYHLHRELVDTSSEGACSVCLCASCHMAAKKPEGSPPPNSIAGGLDYGLLSRVDLEPLSPFEQLLLADVRT